jgi:tripartite-type tricarboxylate transporter receptor subunit TctC
MHMMSLPRRQFFHLAVGAAAVTAFPRFASALDYPTRPVRIIVGFPAASATDVVARLIAQSLSARLGQQVIVENRPGAGSNVAAEAVVHAAPDGYTLLAMTITNTVNATLYHDLNFDITRDIAPIVPTFKSPLVMVVTPALGIKAVPELIAYAKAHPGKLNYASFGNGSAPHINGELFKMKAGIDMVHVPYRGSPVPDLLAGQVQVLIAPMPVLIGQIRAGKLPALAVTSATRSDALPDVPSLADFVPGYDTAIWHGIAAPGNTPADIIDRLNKEINAVLTDSTIKARFAENGGVPIGGSPADLAKLIDDEKKKWGEVIQAANIKPE